MSNKMRVSRRYFVVLLFVVLSVASVLLMGKVNINYNISDYLAEDTETKISLNIIEEEFGMTGDIQVMVEDVDSETAREIQDIIKNIPNVLTVNFNENDENYYKDNNALFAVIVDGDEYSDVANTVLDDIGEALDEEFTTNFGGSVVSKRNLRMAIQKEVIMILAIALALVVLLMLVTSSSWVEPFVLLLASGVAVLLNMGTNLIFGEISYITNAVSGILQLALSIDYSIVLLHGYHAIRETEKDSSKAMMAAIKSVFKPVSASALTTMTGLLALLFMTMKIGFDIGIVLLKGILLSAVVSLTFLPALLLIFEKLMQKTTKRAIVLKGEGFCKLAIKAGKVIVPVALAVILVCGLLQTKNTYSFTDSSGDNPNITDTFGKNQTVIIVYPNENNDYKGEGALAEKLMAYKTADGKTVLKSYTAYSNTVREMYDIEKATEKLNMPESDVEMLFVMYHLYDNSSSVELTPIEFAKYTDELARNDADAKGFMSEDTAKTLRTLIAIDKIMNGSHTAEQFHALVGEAVSDSDLKLFAIEQMYGLYFYDSVADKSVNFEAILDFAVETVNGSEFGDLLPSEAASGLTQLSDGIDQFKAQMDKEMTEDEFRAYLLEEQGIEISEEQMHILYSAYFASKNETVKERIPFLPLMNYLVSAGQVTDAEAIAGIEQLNELAELDVADFRAQMDRKMTASEFREYMLTEQGMELDLSQVQLLYCAYFAAEKGLVQDSIPFLPLMNYLVSAGQVTDAEAIAGIEQLNELYTLDAVEFKAQMDKPMTSAEFKEYMKTEQGIELSTLQLVGIYVGYFNSINEEVQSTIPFLKLMNYLVSAGHVTDADAIASIEMLGELYEMDIESVQAQMDTPMTKAAFREYMKTEQNTEISEEQVDILYAAYAATKNGVVEDTIAFLPIMNYLVSAGQVTDGDAIASIEMLGELYAMDLEGIKAQLSEEMTAEEFREYLSDEYGIELDAEQVKLIYAAYSNSSEDSQTIPFLPLMKYLVSAGQISDADAVAKIDALDGIYKAIPNAYAYDELIPMMEQAATALTGEPVTLDVDERVIQQLYIMYFYDNGTMPSGAIAGRDFVDFVIETAKENPIVSSQLSADTNAQLSDICIVDEFLGDQSKYDFKEMTARVEELKNEIKSISASDELDESAISGVYIKYAIGEKLGLDAPIMACDLLDFVVEMADSNKILGAKMTEDAREKLGAAQEAMKGAEGLLIGENYTRMLLSIDLPAESAESSAFVEYLIGSTKDALGEDAHVAGEMVSTYDLQVSFDNDNKLISIFTIVSIFIIVMIIFRSLSLPVILVAVIQGAIWIAMSTSLLTGPMFFMSYIMATCILMGSTIDYGILMSTNYVQYRTAMDRKEALYRSVKAAMPTVFTSGLILTVCGFVVGFVASQNSISTVGILLGKGTLVSTVMITVVLPAVLYLLDGFILKLSMKRKK